MIKLPPLPSIMHDDTPASPDCQLPCPICDNPLWINPSHCLTCGSCGLLSEPLTITPLLPAEFDTVIPTNAHGT